MNPRPSTMVIGVFKGMGDLLCAAPVIRAELRRNTIVHLLLFPNATLLEFCRLIDFAPHAANLHLHAIPSSASATNWWHFLRAMSSVDPELVWISPHAPKADSSWKIPLALRLLQTLFWPNAELAGADSERLSILFERRLPVRRSLPLQLRECDAYQLLLGNSIPDPAPAIEFLPEIMACRKAPPLYDLVIHPGATAKNRKWPITKYAPLLKDLPDKWRIAFLGLPDDLAEVKATIPLARPVDYVAGTIRTSIETLASARLLLVMDSGNMHFAQVLQVPAVAVFGYTDPADIIDPHSYVHAIYDPRLPCQPCRKAICSQPEVYCLQSIEPKTVSHALLERYGKDSPKVRDLKQIDLLDRQH